MGPAFQGPSEVQKLESKRRELIAQKKTLFDQIKVFRDDDDAERKAKADLEKKKKELVEAGKPKICNPNGPWVKTLAERNKVKAARSAVSNQIKIADEELKKLDEQVNAAKEAASVSRSGPLAEVKIEKSDSKPRVVNEEKRASLEIINQRIAEIENMRLNPLNLNLAAREKECDDAFAAHKRATEQAQEAKNLRVAELKGELDVLEYKEWEERQKSKSLRNSYSNSMSTYYGSYNSKSEPTSLKACASGMLAKKAGCGKKATRVTQ